MDREVVPPIVDQAWVEERLGEIVLADVRWSLDGTDGRDAYRQGHLPGAVFVDLDVDLADPPTAAEGRHPLPSTERFAERMGALGIGDDDVVVGYDQGHGGFAARLVWMLRATGHRAALLDGGLAAWTGDVAPGEVDRESAAFHAPDHWPTHRLASIDEVVSLAGTPGTVVVDSRAAERYRGEVEPVDARAGHVPGAVNLPFPDNLEDGRYRDAAQLAERFAAARAADDVIVYCGSGVTACQNLLAMEAVGIEARLFPGSWSQWAARDDLPIETGPPGSGVADGART